MLRSSVVFAHGPFTFNEHLSALGVVDRSKVKNTVALLERQSMPGFRDLREPLHLAQGGTLGRVHKGLGIILLKGKIQVPDASQQSTLSDRERALRAAFDPYLCYRDSPSTEGAYGLTWSEPTADGVTYPTGVIPVRLYCRPVEQPRVAEALEEGTSRPFSVTVVAPDPRLYEQTEQTLVLSSGTLSGSAVNRGTTPAPLKLTIVMAGAGSASFTIARGTTTFGLDLSGLAAGNTVVVLMETSGPYGPGKTVTLNGAAAFTRKTTGPATWLDVPAGATTFTLTNATNVTSCTLAWYSARA